jgi:hypothetical protein
VIKKPVMRRFLKQHVIPEFDRFFIHRDDMLLRITALFLHGVYFQRSAYDEDFYVHPFVEFLPDGLDFIGFTIGGRVGRIDSPHHYRPMFNLEPAQEEAEVIVRSIRASRYYPHIIHPTCRSLLDEFDADSLPVWTYHGLACCAIMEGERDRAARLLKRFDDIMIQFDDDNSRAFHEMYLTLSARLDNLDWCRDFLWRRAEESIRLKKLEKIAELSGWKPG